MTDCKSYMVEFLSHQCEVERHCRLTIDDRRRNIGMRSGARDELTAVNPNAPHRVAGGTAIRPISVMPTSTGLEGQHVWARSVPRWSI